MSEATYLARFARQKIKVQGTVVEVLIMGDGAELPIGKNLSEEMDRVAAQLAYWGAIMADAQAELTKVDAWYRRFRAQASAAVLAKDPKAAEWKVKNAVESTEGFVQHKEAISQAEKNVGLTEAMFRAFDKKANQLQSRGASMRSEKGAIGMSTPAEPRGWNLSGEGSEQDDLKSPTDGLRNRPSDDERIKRMEQINSARRAQKRKRDT